MKRTAVISLKGRDRSIFDDPDFVYVGRDCFGWPRSDWANPFSRQTPAENVEAFRLYLRRDRPDLLARIGELRGKTLGCWCLDWSGLLPPHRPCHAVLLAQLADESGAEARAQDSSLNS